MAVALESSAELYTLEASSHGEGPMAFSKEAFWVDESGAKVRTVPSSGNDYLVQGRLSATETMTICVGAGGTDASDYTFGGDSLQIGVVGGDPGEFMHDGQGRATVGNLILANGVYRQWQYSKPRTSKSYICGKTKVISPFGNPFNITPSNGGSGWTVQWDAELSSDGTDVGLLVGAGYKFPASSPVVIFAADNGGYKGSIIASGSGTQCKFATGKSLGGAADVFNPKGVVFRNGATLVPDADALTLSASAQRGLYVEEGGGVLDIPDGWSLRVEWPFGGMGELVKTGGGTLTLASALAQEGVDSEETLAVSGGTVVFAPGFSNTASTPVVVRPGGAVAVADGETVTVGNLRFDGGSIQLSSDAATAGILELGSDCQPDWPIPVRPCATREVKIPFLKVPLSMGTITSASFVESADMIPSGLPSLTFTVETVGEYQVAKEIVSSSAEVVKT